MIRFLLFTLLLIIAPMCSAQFPKLCEGSWQGELEFWNNGKATDTIGIKLFVERLPGDTMQWTWRTTYYVNGVEDTSFAKDYKMVERDANSGRYVLDEGDGIMLDCYVFGHKLYSTFSVEGQLLTAVYEISGDQLIFEVTSGSKLKGKHQGVSGFTTDHVQRVVFRKV